MRPPPRRRIPPKALILAAGSLLLFAAAEAVYRRHLAGAPPSASGAAFELYVVGESTAEGFPFRRELAPAWLVSRMFADSIRGRKIRVIFTARSGDSIYPQSVALERELRRRNRRNPGAVVIYSGHNDAGQARGLPLFERLKEGVLHRSALLSDLLFFAEKRSLIPRIRTLETWQHHLRRVVEMSRRSGLVPVLTTAVSDIADMDPGLGASERMSRARIGALFSRGEALEAARGGEAALRYYSRLMDEHPDLRSYLAYRMGKILQSAGRHGEARRRLWEAVDSGPSGGFGRATSRQNGFIRSLARQSSTPLVDAVAIFETRSPGGLMGGGLFSDGQHPSMRGYLLLAEAMARRLSEEFQEPVRRTFREPEDVFREFSCGPDCQAHAHVVSGRWLLSVAGGHALPRLRLDRAAASFRRARALRPDSFDAWLGLGITEAALRSGLLTDPESLAWLGRLRWFHGGEGDITAAELRALLQRMRAARVPDSIIQKILRLQPARSDAAER
ncbi:MAG: hypothetical protein HY926_09640 [Elusimicrobia bacterium]|nr:hypothetical protein [Elusimicrobiota bacterium]